MTERKINSTTAAALVLWPLGFVLIVLDLLSGIETGELGLYSAGGAGVLNIRGFFCALARREQNAFNIGRDYAEATARVRSVR